MSARRWRVRHRPEVNTPGHSAVRSRSMVVAMMISFMEVKVSPVIDDVAKPTITIATNCCSNDVKFYGSEGITSDS